MACTTVTLHSHGREGGRQRERESCGLFDVVPRRSDSGIHMYVGQRIGEGGFASVVHESGHTCGWSCSIKEMPSSQTHAGKTCYPVNALHFIIMQQNPKIERMGGFPTISLGSRDNVYRSALPVDCCVSTTTLYAAVCLAVVFRRRPGGTGPLHAWRLHDVCLIRLRFHS